MSFSGQSTLFRYVSVFPILILSYLCLEKLSCLFKLPSYNPIKVLIGMRTQEHVIAFRRREASRIFSAQDVSLFVSYVTLLISFICYL